MSESWIPIGELARRSGVAASALRFYEEQGLLGGQRSAAGRRQYPRSALRRVAFIRAAQAMGLSLEQVRAALATLPGARTPTQGDWQRLSRGWRPLLDERIAALTRLRDQLDSCIGCGCLSLKTCALYNPADAAAVRGAGPRYLLGDRSADVLAAPVTPGSPARAAAPAGRPRSPRKHPGRT
jgi:MerR family redox-sensitive transcriptional activator SoxR